VLLTIPRELDHSLKTESDDGREGSDEESSKPLVQIEE